MNPVRLGNYENSWFKPGRSILTRLAWFLAGSPIVRSSWIPSSGIRVSLLRLFGAQIGQGVVIKPGVRIKFPWNLAIGSDSWIGEDAWIDNLTQVRIGSNVCVSQAAYFCTGNHDWTDPAFGLIVRPIELHDGAWAGSHCVLAPGITLGECAVAAAGSVVMRDIPPYEIHIGNPATFVKKRVIKRPLERAGSAQTSPLRSQLAQDSEQHQGVRA